MSDKASEDLRTAQAVFIQQMNEFLVKGPLKLGQEGATLVTRSLVVNTMRSIQVQNLEALDELARDYLLNKD